MILLSDLILDSGYAEQTNVIKFMNIQLVCDIISKYFSFCDRLILDIQLRSLCDKATGVECIIIVAAAPSVLNPCVLSDIAGKLCKLLIQLIGNNQSDQCLYTMHVQIECFVKYNHLVFT